jgi:hypothetical protein
VENAARTAYPEHTAKISMIGIEPPQGLQRSLEGAEAFVRQLEERGDFSTICFRVLVGFLDPPTGRLEFVKHAEVRGESPIQFFWPPRSDWASTPLIYFKTPWSEHLAKAATP